MKNSYVGVCAALILCAVTAVGQQNSNSTTAGKEANPDTSKLTATSDADDAGSVGTVKKSSPSFSKSSWRPQGDTDPDKWNFDVSLYVWAAALKGDLRVRNTTTHVGASFRDIFNQLDFVFVTHFEAVKKRWRVLIDENYINLGITGTGPLGESTNVQPTLNFFELGGSYAPIVIHNTHSTASEPLPPVFSLEVLGGVRYTHVGLGLQRAGNPGVEGNRNLVDFFAGNRFKIRPHPKVTLVEKYTLGGGGSSFAWTFTSLVDYSFRKSFSAFGGYQVVNMNADKPSNVVGFDGQLRGFVFGMSIHK